MLIRLSCSSKTLVLATLVIFSTALLRDSLAFSQDSTDKGLKLVASEFVFDHASFPQCHASTIEQSAQGTLVAAWFGGTREKNPDVGIWVSRKIDGQWSVPVEVANGIQFTNAESVAIRHPCWNPVLFQPSDGPLMLFYKCGPDPRSWWGMLMTSNDSGRTWSHPRRLPEGIDGPVKNKPIELADGTILCGSSTEYNGWRVHFELTPDQGRTWQRIGPVNDGIGIGAIQPSMVRLGGDRLAALGRTRQKKIFRIESGDNGRSWGKMALTDLPNPNSGTDAITLKDGRHVMVFNNTPRGRSPLSVAVSKDSVHWTTLMDLESEPGEYSYPAVIQSRDGKVHISYTWRRERIKHVVLQ